MATVAIVGRPNVGKSMLFNRLAGRDVSIVFDRPGVTRDRLAVECRWGDRPVELIDTGGIGLDDDTGFAEAIEREAQLAVEAADALLWVVDAREGLTPLDQEIAGTLRRTSKPVFLVANKIDHAKQQYFEAEFARLGFGTPFPVSAAHGLGIDKLKQAVAATLPMEQAAAEAEVLKGRPTRLTFVGRPNVGKSSLVNAVLGDQRTIVSPQPGTTRDAVEIPFQRRTPHGDSAYNLVDTAGLRQKRRMTDDLEASMSGRTAHAINQADLCLLVITADTGLTAQDKKIGGLIQKAMKPCIVVVNKWDLAQAQPVAHELIVDGRKTKTFVQVFEEAVRRELFFLNYAPVVFASALDSTGMQKVFNAIDLVSRNMRTAMPTGPLNRVIGDATEASQPPLREGRRFRILYATAERNEGRWLCPTIVAFCNDLRHLEPQWLQYLEGRLRKEFPLAGVPIRWIWRSRAQAKKGK